MYVQVALCRCLVFKVTMAVGRSSSLSAPSLAPNLVTSQTNLSNDKQVYVSLHIMAIDIVITLKAPAHTRRNASNRMAQLRYMRDDALLGPRWKFWRRRRYIIGVLAMLGFFNVYSLQVILSMTIVAMTSDRTTRLQNGTDIRISADFSWDSRVQGLLLSSFFCGYLVAQVPGGWLAARVGGRLVMGCGVGTAALLTLMVPTLCAVAATHHALMVLRMIQGLVLAGCTPSINAVWSRWAPPQERSSLATLAMSGVNLGTMATIMGSGIINDIWDWPAVYYTIGTAIQVSELYSISADFSWDSRVQGLLLSSFFCGYLVAQVPGGWLAARVGGRLVMGCGVGTAALLTLMVPTLCAVAATHHALMVLRMIQGLVLAGCTPSINAVWSRWAPPQERSSLATLAMSGVNLGTMATIMGSGIINDIWDWPAVYYTIGTLGVMWSFTWIYLVRDDPGHDPRISSQESNYLKEVLNQLTAPNQAVKYPWMEFVSSPAVWAIFVAHFVMDWGLFTSITQLPTFLKDTLKIDLEYIGYILATPYLMMIFVMQFTGRASDWLVGDNILSQTQVRKVFLCGSYTLNSFLMLLAGLLQDPVAATLCLVVALVVLAVSMAVVCVTSNISVHCTNAASASDVVLKSAEEWNIVFYLVGAMFLVGALVFLVFGSGERQSWADQQHHPSDKTQFCYTNSELSDDIPE
uniref:Major facilitator superfamily (MFS) profile domain-containing protein n=1 Tax=Timema cristinae TaxID=61476 RepID=A0A7R9CKG9_TIMCR|nr:unnamed protein product [Timema cristinae]